MTCSSKLIILMELGKWLQQPISKVATLGCDLTDYDDARLWCGRKPRKAAARDTCIISFVHTFDPATNLECVCISNLC